MKTIVEMLNRIHTSKRSARMARLRDVASGLGSDLGGQYSTFPRPLSPPPKKLGKLLSGQIFLTRQFPWVGIAPMEWGPLVLGMFKSARVRQSLVAQPIVGGTIVKNRHVADGRLLSRRTHAVHDWVEGLWLFTLAKPSCGSHLRRRIQSACSSPVAPRIHVTHIFKFRCPRTPGTPCVVHPTDKRTGFSETPIQAFESFPVRQAFRRKSFHVQLPGLQGIPNLNTVNEMDIGHFLIRVADDPYSRKKREHDECFFTSQGYGSAMDPPPPI
ncbi:hypothetical protein TNIN_445011 [Trichonephila inaurata madagascariensis]|uniref:Uncharacterized protein n=1 Tax=Trichonephila inaurata madagascariensis TaxID=2747483 RepID=A0A8X6XXT7_9ARAC|nr:hypothetical protein TNIN_445011 [Trichonephila inaurata madagascariensis]